MRAVITLPCVLLLAGCAMVGLSRGQSSPLEPGDMMTPAAADGVLVYGVVLRRPATSEGEAEGAVTWLLEKADQSFPAMVSIALPDGLRPNQRGVVAWRVPAGTWSVRQVEWRDESGQGASLPASARALATTVAAGQVTYAGEIVVDATRQPAELSIGSDPAAARAALAAFPGVTAPIAEQPLRDLRLAPEGGHRHSLVP